MKKLIDRRVTLVFLLLLFFSLMTVGIILFDTSRPDTYKYLWVLPLVNILILTTVCYTRPSVWRDFCFLVIALLFSIRNVVTPFFMCLGGYYGFFKMIDMRKVNGAIFLMALESFFVITYSVYRSHKNRDLNAENNVCIGNCKDADILFALSVIFGIVNYVIRPDFYSGYRTIFQTQDLRVTETAESALGPMFTLFSVIFPITYIYCALYLLNRVNRMKRCTLRTILNFAIVGIPLLFMNNGDGFTIICIGSLALTALKIGGITHKQFFTMGTTFLVGILLLLFTLINNGYYGSLLQTLSAYLQAYFPGVGNFAGYYNIQNHDKLLSLFYDIYYTIPFRNTIIGIPGDYRLVILYTADNEARSHILPCFIQLFYYFGILAPFVELIYIKFAFKSFNKAKNSKNVYEYFFNIITWVYLVLTPIMYNFTILMTRLLLTMVLLYFISKNLGRKVIKQKPYYVYSELGDTYLGAL